MVIDIYNVAVHFDSLYNTGVKHSLSVGLGPVFNILAIVCNANVLKKENKNILHQRYRLSVIYFN